MRFCSFMAGNGLLIITSALLKELGNNGVFVNAKAQY
jgi:hypothetical protein